MKAPLVETSAPVARINVTPIIDVALVLVIVLLITAPMLTVRDLGIQLPDAETRGPEDEARISITLGQTGELALDEDLVTMETLVGELRERLAEDEDRLVVVRADQVADYRQVEDVLRLTREAGVRRVAIATRQKTGEAS